MSAAKQRCFSAASQRSYKLLVIIISKLLMHGKFSDQQYNKFSYYYHINRFLYRMICSTSVAVSLDPPPAITLTFPIPSAVAPLILQSNYINLLVRRRMDA